TQTKQALTYDKIEAPVDDFTSVVKGFFAQTEGKGLNVTVPFKEQAWDMCDKRSLGAEKAGAVNTLYLDEQGLLCGDNTDGLGLVSDIQGHGISLSGKKILILGAGGAVRGVLQPILEEKPSKVVVANRTVSKADALVDLFQDQGSIESSSFEALNEAFDLVINGTSASLSGSLPPISKSIIGAATVAYDMMYGSEQTVFNRWAEEAGASQTIDGLGMLVGQAAEAFRVWRGILPETSEVMARIREES
ncbi:shikimate dehydrogenase, partial [Oleiphilus sp. HI0068]